MPDVRFYCHLPSHDEAVNSIAYSIANGDSLITVTGEIGVGKTIVCKKVIRILEKENHIVFNEEELATIKGKQTQILEKIFKIISVIL